MIHSTAPQQLVERQTHQARSIKRALDRHTKLAPSARSARKALDPYKNPVRRIRKALTESASPQTRRTLATDKMSAGPATRKEKQAAPVPMAYSNNNYRKDASLLHHIFEEVDNGEYPDL